VQFPQIRGDRGKRHSLPMNHGDMAATPFLRRKILASSGAQSERDAEPLAPDQQSVQGVTGWPHMQTPRLCYPRCRASLPIRFATN
jgi:hypothetical protein